MPDLDIAAFFPKSTTAWRGRVSSVVFVPGCNLSCGYCFSGEMVTRPMSLPRISKKDVLGFMFDKKNEVKAVVVTGGEPTLHGQRLMNFLEECQNGGLLTRIETNGTNPFLIRTLVERDLVDSIALDLKAPLYPEKYLAATNKSALVAKIKKSVFLVMHAGIDYEFRTVVVPGYHSASDILSIAKSVKGAKRFVLHQFVPDNGTISPLFSKKPATSYDELIEIAQKIRGIQEVRIFTKKGEETVNPLLQMAAK
ncbi:MAG: anaerobic ribonucleoside-triphosphate reductase activating protein [Candidatus Micrarchaeota archaeon]